jgi:hypothetical protein
MDKRAIKIPTSSMARPSNIDPNWDFWFENVPFGNHCVSTYGYFIKSLMKAVFSEI